jgi:hypothetical protein
VGRNNLEDLGVEGRITLKCILKKQYVRGLDSIGSGQGSVPSSYEHGNEPPSCMEGVEFLE